MLPRERISSILSGDPVDRCGFWTGNPHEETERKYLSQMGMKDREDLFTFLQDDCRWFPADEAYRHPEGKPAFDPLKGRERRSLGEPGCFADCTSPSEVEVHDWPDPGYLDFGPLLEKIRRFPRHGVLTGMWSPFFHVVADFFGMENYFIKMHTDPAVVQAVTEHVVDYYVEANSRFFTVLEDEADTFFFGNDFGSQKDLLISPASFETFVLPGLKRLIETASRFGKKIVIHSCGAIAKLIPAFIDAGIDGVHPLQARAKGMDAASLAREFSRKIAFIGGVDTQDLLIHCTPQEIRDEVRRLKDLFGPRFIVSPSHEAILPNVPIENVIAMTEAARE